MSEVAEKAAEITAEVVEESIDGVVDVVEVVRNNPVALALVGAAGLVAGGVGGYFIAKKRLSSFYEERITREIAEAKEFYAGLNKVNVDGEPLSPQEILEQRHGSEAATMALREYQGRQAVESVLTDDEQDEVQIRKIEKARITETSLVTEVDPEHGVHPVELVEKSETVNVFTDPHFDLDEEMKHRTPAKPYIITHDEFFTNEPEHENVSLTYYELDDTLTNERDEPIREVDEMIGDDHLVRFGHGSRDRNVVYIRNERLGTDFEVSKSTGSYLEEVLGMPDEPDSLKHSDQRDRRRAFKHGDG